MSVVLCMNIKLMFAKFFLNKSPNLRMSYMTSIWASIQPLYELYMSSIWGIELYTSSIWALYELYMSSIQALYELYTTLFNIYMTSIWHLYKCEDNFEVMVDTQWWDERILSIITSTDNPTCPACLASPERLQINWNKFWIFFNSFSSILASEELFRDCRSGKKWDLGKKLFFYVN